MDFLSFSMNSWEDLWQSRHQVMSRLARDHKVLFVSPPFYVHDVLSRSRRATLPKSGLLQRENNLHTLVPPKWLFENHRFDALNRFSAYLRELQVHRILRNLGFHDVVLFLWNPRYADLPGRFSEKVSCYYVDEEFTSYYDLSKEEKQSIRKKEDALLERVDLVFANGSALLEQKSSFGNAFNVPMGVDFDLFSKALLPETAVSPDLAALPSPRIGYVGNVNDKVDFELLYNLACRRKSWSIVLVGPVSIRTPEFAAHFEKLKTLPNVFHLGFKPIGELPNYVKGLDVCLMCYRTDGWAYFGYPLKLHEYLAGGKPVVSSDLPSIREFDGLIRIVHTDDEWMKAIELSLSDNESDTVQKRVRVASQNTWDERVRVIEEAIARKMSEKTAFPPG